MNITYTIDLCHLYDNNFATGYSRVLDENDNILTDEIWGYTDCKFGDDDDKKRVEEEIKNKIGKYLDEAIDNNKIDINEYKKYMNKLNISYMRLNKIKYTCKDGIEYTIRISINTELKDKNQYLEC